MIREVPGAVVAPAPGTITKMEINSGDKVEKGERIAVIEAMKIENYIVADKSGVVKEIMVSEGEGVRRGDPIVKIE